MSYFIIHKTVSAFFLDTNTENEMYKQELKSHGHLVASGD
jgi:hypothetical protein